jgi:micrococcal nuclease
MIQERTFCYAAQVIRAIDGDTIDVNVDLGFGIWKHEIVRLARVDAPELHSGEALVHLAAMKAKEFVANKITGSRVIVRTAKGREKYGRYLAEVFYPSGTEQRNLSDDLLAAGLARPYEGGKK